LVDHNYKSLSGQQRPIISLRCFRASSNRVS
jgi:hypothetical protein